MNTNWRVRSGGAKESATPTNSGVVRIEARNQGKVAIFQAKWPLDAQTTNLAIMFTEIGLDVDLFLYRTSNDINYAFHEIQKLDGYMGVRVHDLQDPRPAEKLTLRRRFVGLVRRTMPRLASALFYGRSVVMKARVASRPPKGSEAEIERTPPSVVRQTLECMEKKTYCCLVGVEKDGLVWAGTVAHSTGIPFLYYSLELYLADCERFHEHDGGKFKRMRAAERHFHNAACGTIIQDFDRARALFEENGVPWDESKVFLLPVSVLGPPLARRSWFFHDRFGLPRTQKIILYFGNISERRLLLELVDIAQIFPVGWSLVIHGWGNESSIANTRARDTGGRVLFSLDLISSADLPHAIGSGDIGLAFYSNETKNDRLTAFSSAKMAIYMQAGVPFIAFSNPGYDQLACDDRCGRVISAMQDLPNAIHEIFAEPELFRKNAFRAFARHYDFAANFRKISGRLAHLGRVCDVVASNGERA